MNAGPQKLIAFLGKLAASPFLLYLLFFLAFFLQLPLNGSLPGNNDTWHFLAAFNNIGNHIEAFFTGDHVGTALYPESNVYSFGSYSFGCAFFFLPFKWMGFGDIWSYYFFITLVFASNAYGCYVLAKGYGAKKWFAFFAGFTFAASNFAFSSIDNPDALIFFFAFLSIHFFRAFLNQPTNRNLLLFICLGGIEVYFSGYAFLFQCLFIALIAAIRFRKTILQSKFRNRLLLGLPLFLLLIFPYCKIYFFNDSTKDKWNPGEKVETVAIASLNPDDLVRFHENNLTYPPQNDLGFNWLYSTRSAGLGILIYILALAGIWKGAKNKELIFGFLFFLVLAIGPSITINGAIYNSPLRFFYDWWGFHNYLRISVRAYFMCALVLSVLAAFGLQYLVTKKPKQGLVIALLLCVFSLENVPWKMYKYDSEQHLQPPTSYTHFFSEKSGEVILNLPSSFYSGFHPDFATKCIGEEHKIAEFEFCREFLYVLWQTHHKNHILNGYASYIPASRIRNQRLINDIALKDNLKKLIVQNELSYIAYHKHLLIDCEDNGELHFLMNSKVCTPVFEDKDVIIFATDKR